MKQRKVIREPGREARAFAERLDAYIEAVEVQREAGAPPPDAGIEGEARAVDLLQEEARSTRVDPAFIDRLGEQLQQRHRERYAATPAWRRWLSTWSKMIGPQQRRSLRMRLTWGATTLVAVLTTLAAVLILRPTTLPPERILAEAEVATRREPDKIEHVIIETRFETPPSGAAMGSTGYVEESWRRIGATLDEHLTTVEQSTVRYALTDTGRTQPLSWVYETWSRHCFLEVAYGQGEPIVYRDQGTDEAGCLLREEMVHLTLPAMLEPALEASPQTWIARLQVNPQALIDQATTFDEQPVYSLTEVRDGITLTLYIDQEHYMPVAFIAKAAGYHLTQIVHHYEIVTPERLYQDPFLWPPGPLQAQQPVLRPPQ